MKSGVRDQPGQHGENPVSTKNTKISQTWCREPIIPATHEAEAVESLEPRSPRPDHVSTKNILKMPGVVVHVSSSSYIGG